MDGQCVFVIIIILHGGDKGFTPRLDVRLLEKSQSNHIAYAFKRCVKSALLPVRDICSSKSLPSYDNESSSLSLSLLLSYSFYLRRLRAFQFA